LPHWDSVVGSIAPGAFREAGLDVPRTAVVCNSLQLQNAMLATGRYLSVLPESMLRFGPKPLAFKKPPIPPLGSMPCEILTVKNQTLSPVVKFFIDGTHEVAKPLTRRTR